MLRVRPWFGERGQILRTRPPPVARVIPIARPLFVRVLAARHVARLQVLDAVPPPRDDLTQHARAPCVPRFSDALEPAPDPFGVDVADSARR